MICGNSTAPIGRGYQEVISKINMDIMEHKKFHLLPILLVLVIM